MARRAGPDVEDDDAASIVDLLTLGVRRLLVDPDPVRFGNWFTNIGSLGFRNLLPDFGPVRGAKAGPPDGAAAVATFRLLAFAVVRATPLPVHGWKAPPLEPPHADAPCLCGSGRPFGRCCAPLLDAVPAVDADLLGALVVDALPRRDWPGLVHAPGVQRYVLGAAELLQEEGELAAAVRLLEPWAALPPPWPAENADLLDRLGDLYLDLDKPRKRKQLAERMVEHGAPAVQAKGWQRLAMLAADRGDLAAGRDAFERAQRLAPDDPSLAVLEVTLHHAAGEPERARERAAFHARRLARLPNAAELADAVDALEQLAEPASALNARVRDSFGVGGFPALVALEASIAKLPPPRLRLALPKAPSTDLGALRPDAAAGRALRDWAKASPVDPPKMTFDAPGIDFGAVESGGRWLAVLKAQPVLLDCFEVLDSLLLVADALPFGLAAGLANALERRGLALWALLRERFPQARCEWAWLENRPALRLLARVALADDTPRAEHSLDWLRHLVEVANPHDNHGLRERLAAVLLRRGDAAAALALCECYPHDRVGMALLHARALLALRRIDDAAAKLREALASNPHAKAVLLGARAPRPPDVPSYALGSAEEARIAIAPQWDLWRDEPAVRAWLRGRLDGRSPQGPGLFDGDTQR